MEAKITYWLESDALTSDQSNVIPPSALPRTAGCSSVSRWLKPLALALFMSPLASPGNPAEFRCYKDGNNLLLVHYTGPGGAVSIPAVIDGLPVAGVHGNAFTGRI